MVCQMKVKQFKLILILSINIFITLMIYLVLSKLILQKSFSSNIFFQEILLLQVLLYPFKANLLYNGKLKVLLISAKKSNSSFTGTKQKNDNIENGRFLKQFDLPNNYIIKCVIYTILFESLML